MQRKAFAVIHGSAALIVAAFCLGGSVPVLHHSPVFRTLVAFVTGFIHERLFGN